MSLPKRFKVLFVTSELFPFIKTGGLADVSAALPQMLSELGHEVRIIVPKYGAIDSRRFKIHDVVRLKDIVVKVGDKDVVFSLKSSFLPSQKVRVQIYFLENAEFFGSRKSLYSDPITGVDYKDNDERFIILSKAVFQLIIRLLWTPDIIHCNDWQCGLIPAYFKTFFKKELQFSKMKTLFTIHNLSYQGIFNGSVFEKTNLPKELNSDKGILHDGKVNFMKSGLMYADCINTVSSTYAKEIVDDKALSSGLNAVLSKRKNSVYGIVNGIDNNIWNPEFDKFIPKKYSIRNFSNKLFNKQALVERFGLTYNENTPVVGVISRLLDTKGMDLIADAFDEMMKLDMQLILLGTGEKKYHQLFEKLSKKYSNKFACYIGFNDDLAHLIEAGADIYLMPSKYEPCGLNQMYSLVYGTVPVVRETGGLADTVEKYNEKTEEGTGFIFKNYSSDAMLKELKRALIIFNDKKTWAKIVKNGMKQDFTWQSSAKKYIELYKTVLEK